MSAPLPSNDPEPLNFQGVLKHLWHRLLAGVLVAVPLVVTFWVLNIAYKAIDGISAPFYKTIGIQGIPGLGFVTTLVCLVLIGFMATHVLGRQIIERVEELILRVPLISPVYGAVKQALESFRNMKANPQFKRVAYIEYPSEGCFLIGFVTGQFWESGAGREMTMVFLPTTPNPLTGFVVAVPTEKVIESDLTLEQASKIIISAGLVAPPRPVAVPALGRQAAAVKDEPYPQRS